MRQQVSQFIREHERVAKFLIVGLIASAVHGCISWIFFYHVWDKYTLLSTLMGYGGGWLVSYLGNRLWSFRVVAKDTAIVSSAVRFIIGQLVTMCILLVSTWTTQQLIMLYFWWYIITNHLTLTPELSEFSQGASYPPALAMGMAIAALCSYLIMNRFVFSKRS